MGAKKKGKKGGKKKKTPAEIPFVHPLPNFKELLTPPMVEWQAELDSRIDTSNTPEGSQSIQACSKVVKGKVPNNYSFNMIREKILKEFGNSLGNLRLYYKDEKTGERRDLSEIMHKPLKECLAQSSEIAKFVYDFDPFVHPMLEASVAMAKEKKDKED